MMRRGHEPAIAPAAPGGLLPRLDVLASGFAIDRDRVLASLRRQGGVARAGPAAYAIGHHGAVIRLLEDRRLGHGAPASLRARFGGGGEALAGAADLLGGIVSSLDGQGHNRVRRLVMKAMSRVPAASLAGPEMDESLRSLLVSAVGRGRFDATRDVAYPLQSAATCRLVGIPGADGEAVMEQATRLGRAIILAPLISERIGTGLPEARWLASYVRDLLAERRARPREDVLSAMAAVDDDHGRLSDDEIVSNAIFLLFAGFETAVQLVSGIFVALARAPHAAAALRADRGLVPLAVDEVLRLESPLQWVSRFTMADIEIGGRTFPAGRLLLLLLGSANHDEREFADPEAFDPNRRVNRHVAFGGGEHHCINRARVRALGARVLESLLHDDLRFELCGEPALLDHPTIRLYATAPMAASAAAA